MSFEQQAGQNGGIEEGHRSWRRPCSTASPNGVGGTSPVQTLSLPRLATLPCGLLSISITILPGPADTLSFWPAAIPAARRRSRERTIRFDRSSRTVEVMAKATHDYGTVASLPINYQLRTINSQLLPRLLRHFNCVAILEPEVLPSMVRCRINDELPRFACRRVFAGNLDVRQVR